MNFIENEKLYKIFLCKLLVLIGINHIVIVISLLTLQFHITHKILFILFVTYNLFADLVFIVLLRNTIKKVISPYNVILIYLILTFPVNVFLAELLVPSLTHQVSEAQSKLTYKKKGTSHQHSTIEYLFQLQNFNIDIEDQKEVESVFKINYNTVNLNIKYGLRKSIALVIIYILMVLATIALYSIESFEMFNNTFSGVEFIMPIVINVTCVWVVRSILYNETYKVWKKKDYLLYYLLINGTIFNINSGYGFLNSSLDYIKEEQ